MNLWKASTIVMVMGMTVVLGKDGFGSANAAPAKAHKSVAFEWRVEEPHMQKALEDLRGARHSLEIAAEHKGGWRARALQHTDEAIAETVKGMEYGKDHQHE